MAGVLEVGFLSPNTDGFSVTEYELLTGVLPEGRGNGLKQL